VEVEVYDADPLVGDAAVGRATTAVTLQPGEQQWIWFAWQRGTSPSCYRRLACSINYEEVHATGSQPTLVVERCACYSKECVIVRGACRLTTAERREE
jgi:hypothetical protein